MRIVSRAITNVVAALGAAALIGFGARATSPDPPGTRASLPEMINMPAGAMLYRPAGDFTQGGVPPAARSWRIDGPLTIMKYQVTAREYQSCVDARACPAVSLNPAKPDRPIVGVSWWDASAYARWLTRRTGTRFRLPTDQEWAYAAGSRFQDDGQSVWVNAGDPGARSLARYERDFARDPPSDSAPHPIGAFGTNEKGVFDVAGNVWEWTSTCFVRGTLDANGSPQGQGTVNCGVRVVEGRHRTYLPDFIRDARAGGCSVYQPPSNLGFRLVRGS